MIFEDSRVLYQNLFSKEPILHDSLIEDFFIKFKDVLAKYINSQKTEQNYLYIKDVNKQIVDSFSGVFQKFDAKDFLPSYDDIKNILEWILNDEKCYLATILKNDKHEANRDLPSDSKEQHNSKKNVTYNNKKVTFSESGVNTSKEHERLNNENIVLNDLENINYRKYSRYKPYVYSTKLESIRKLIQESKNEIIEKQGILTNYQNKFEIIAKQCIKSNIEEHYECIRAYIDDQEKAKAISR